LFIFYRNYTDGHQAEVHCWLDDLGRDVPMKEDDKKHWASVLDA
jgi:hypothetical protein